MCGRYTLASHDIKLPLLWTSAECDGAATAVGNAVITGDDLRPSQLITVYRSVGSEIRPRPMLWGLIPSWAKDSSFAKSTINCRSETIDEKPAFRGSFKHKRGVVPATGFYEWRRTPEGKRTKDKYRFSMASGEMFYMPALWDTWTSPDGSPLDTVTIITTAANEIVAPIHDRMPGMLTADAAETWIHAEYDPDILRNMLRPIQSDRIIAENCGPTPVTQAAEVVQLGFGY